MRQRTLTGAMIIATLILVLLARQISTYIFDVFILLLTFEGAYEMSKLLAKMNCYNNKYLILLYPLFAYGLFILSINLSAKWYMIVLFELLLIILFVIISLLIGTIRRKTTNNEIATRNLKIKNEMFVLYKSVHTLFGLIYPTLLVLFFVAINNIQNMGYLFDVPMEYLVKISLFGLVLTFAIPIFTDTFAYLTGMTFKGPKLCPKISPNKTLSGAIGGVIWGLVGTLIVYFIFNAIPQYSEAFSEVGFAYWHFIILGFVVSVICELGDLFESWLKRNANVKDSGDILPGHGGILDRMDSHIVCAPLVFIFLIILL